MFENYSQTYAAGITSLAGVLVLVLSHYNVTISSEQISFVIGSLLNAGGVVWALAHRHAQGGVTPLGARRY